MIFLHGRQYTHIFATGAKTERGWKFTTACESGLAQSQERHHSPSEAIIDSQSVKSAAMVSRTVGFDAGKKIKGRKRFMTVDTLGLVLRVLVTAASVGEREGGKIVLKKVKQKSKKISRLTTIWVDGGFDGKPFMRWVMDFCRWIVQVVLRSEHSLGLCIAQKTRLLSSALMGKLMGCRRLVNRR